METKGVLLGAIVLALLAMAKAEASTSQNVLFISVDDLRPELGAYGFDDIHSDNIDSLAEKGTVFRFAYSQMTTCSPSRASTLTGRRPETTRVYNLNTYFRDSPGKDSIALLCIVKLQEMRMRGRIGSAEKASCEIAYASTQFG